MSETLSVVTLIANPAVACLNASLIDKAVKATKATNLCILAENTAADLFLPQGIGQDEIQGNLARVLADAPLDMIIQPIEGRRKRLLLADMDSTIIGQECIDELAEQIGLGEIITALTERAMRGEIDFETALRQRVALLKDLPLSAIDKVIADHITLTPGARLLVATMRKNGAYTALVSGGFTLFTQEIAERVGFDAHHANILCHDGEALTGEVAEPVLGSQAKQQKLLELCQALGLETGQVMAVGDGANDIPMLLEAGSGVAFHAKPQVRAATSMQINHGDLTALLYIQGYKEKDFVS